MNLRCSLRPTRPITLISTPSQRHSSCGAKDLGEALRRIAEGAALIRTKGEPGTGDVIHAVRHMRQIVSEMKALTVLDDQELYAAAKNLRAPYELVKMVAKTGKLPVPNFSAGGIATPADAAMVAAAWRGDGFCRFGHLHVGLDHEAERFELSRRRPSGAGRLGRRQTCCARIYRGRGKAKTLRATSEAPRGARRRSAGLLLLCEQQRSSMTLR